MGSSTSILKQKKSTTVQKYLPTTFQPVVIKCAEGSPAQIQLKSGITIQSTCLGCIDQPCMRFSESELKLGGVFKDFPADQDAEVCATKAISWDDDKKKPVIDNQSCILCGVCMNRCPAKAIFYKDGMLSVAAGSSEYFMDAKSAPEMLLAEKTQKALAVTESIGGLININKDALEESYRRLIEVAKTMSPQFPNLLSRNLMNCIGLKSAIRRRGDVYSRTDLVFYHGQKCGLCEVEFFQTVMLETPRSILDDMAVYISRYQQKKDQISPLIIGLELPNQRSEFWQVIADIKKVQNIQISTLTIGAMFMLVWAQKTITSEAESLPYGDSSNYSIKMGVDHLLGNVYQCSSASYSYFEAGK